MHTNKWNQNKQTITQGVFQKLKITYDIVTHTLDFWELCEIFIDFYYLYTDQIIISIP